MPESDMPARPKKPQAGPNIFALLRPYRRLILWLAGLTIAANALTLWLPKIISHAIDHFARGQAKLPALAWEFGLVAGAIFILTYAQNIVQTFAAERVARDLRRDLSAKISNQSYAYIQQINPARLLTNLTSDIDSVKMFVAQAIATLISSIFLIVGASVLLLIIDWRLALMVLMVIPIIGITFFLMLRKVRTLFIQSREVIDRLNRVITESILGAAVVRVVHAERPEKHKFESANEQSRQIGLGIVNLFAGLIPIITLAANAASLAIVLLGGHFVVTGSMSLGDFSAFTTYLAILIFPIIMIGFMSNVMAQATASYGRIFEVLSAKLPKASGSLEAKLTGKVQVKHLSLKYGQRQALKDVSFTIQPGSSTAILGPTAAGKTQLLSVLCGLVKPTEGEILYDGHALAEYDPISFHQQVGLVFQDSVLFQMTLRENIALSGQPTEVDLEKAIATAELADFVSALPKGLATPVSERGTTLSGGQKQRIMLARALAGNPSVLYLDDFTARVDSQTEQKILANVTKNYPAVAIVSVTQKIASVEHYDHIILLMEGEIVAEGTHKELLKSSPEYMQIYSTQRSTNAYELSA